MAETVKSSLFPVPCPQGQLFQQTLNMPLTPHTERHFTGSETIRDIVIGMSVNQKVFPKSDACGGLRAKK